MVTGFCLLNFHGNIFTINMISILGTMVLNNKNVHKVFHKNIDANNLPLFLTYYKKIIEMVIDYHQINKIINNNFITINNFFFVKKIMVIKSFLLP